MSKVEKYRHGTPCWVDLATVDLPGARAFYGGLFGWEYVDEEMEEMDIGVYSMAMLGGSAAAIFESGPGQIRQDGTAKWNLYVSVDDVDAVIGRVAANGGSVLAGSRDVDRGPDGLCDGAVGARRVRRMRRDVEGRRVCLV